MPTALVRTVHALTTLASITIKTVTNTRVSIAGACSRTFLLTVSGVNIIRLVCPCRATRTHSPTAVRHQAGIVLSSTVTNIVVLTTPVPTTPVMAVVRGKRIGPVITDVRVVIVHS